MHNKYTCLVAVYREKKNHKKILVHNNFEESRFFRSNYKFKLLFELQQKIFLYTRWYNPVPAHISRFFM